MEPDGGAEGRVAAERPGAPQSRRNEKSDGRPPIREQDFAPLLNLPEERRKVLTGFPDAGDFHAVIMLHVAQKTSGFRS